MRMKAVFAIAAVMFLSTVAHTDAQTIFRIGGGVITDGTQPGVGIALDLPMGHKAYGISISADYYTKSGETIAPLRGIALYQIPSGVVDFYVGAGTGIIYSKKTKLGFTFSSTKALATGVAGLRFRAFYAETGFDSALTSDLKNLISIRIGVSFGGQ